MDKGFYHSVRGYWQAVGIDPATHIVGYHPLPPEEDWPRLREEEWPRLPEEKWPLDENGNPYDPGPVDPGPQRPEPVPIYMLETFPEGTIEVPLKPGDNYDWIDGKWKYVAPPIDELRAKTIRSILKLMTEMGRSLVARYPQTEQAGWPEKLSEARAVDAGTMTVEDAFQLGIEASITGESVSDLATATLNASKLTGMIPAITAGLRRRLEQGVAASNTAEELEALQQSATAMSTAIMQAFASADPVQVRATLDELLA